MRLEHLSEERLKESLLKVIGKYLVCGNTGFFFGSRVAGKGSERSDIDVGIEGEEKAPAAALAKIRDEIEELPFLYKIEIVDFKGASPEFRKVALSKIEMLNK